jgi:protein SCO1
MDRHFAAVQREAADDPSLRGRLRLLSVSFDPEFDTPDVLAAHARKVGADPAVWAFVTAPREQLEPFSTSLGVSVIRGDSPDAEIVHNLRTAVIDPHGRLVTVLSGNDWQPSELLAALRKARGGR